MSTGNLPTRYGVQTPPWSKDGVSVWDIDQMSDAMEHAGLDFEVETTPAQHRIERLGELDIENMLLDMKPRTNADYLALVNKAIGQSFDVADNQMVIRRADNHRVFGRCMKNWAALQNHECFDWFQPLLDSGLVKLDTVGSLGGGKKIWLLAKIVADPIVIVPGDEIAQYMFLTNGHDGVTAVGAGFTPLRLYCANMFPQLKTNTATSMIRIRHSANVATKLENLRDMMNLATREFEATAEQYRELCRHQFNQKDVEKYVKKLFCKDDEQDKKLSELSTRKRNIVQRVIDLVDTGYGLQGPQVRGTAFAAFNGVNQYLNYEAGRNSDSRLNSLWYGNNRNMNEQALQVATDMALAV